MKITKDPFFPSPIKLERYRVTLTVDHRSFGGCRDVARDVGNSQLPDFVEIATHRMTILGNGILPARFERSIFGVVHVHLEVSAIAFFPPLRPCDIGRFWKFGRVNVRRLEP